MSFCQKPFFLHFFQANAKAYCFEAQKHKKAWLQKRKKKDKRNHTTIDNKN